MSGEPLSGRQASGRPANGRITDVAGVLVGHATDAEARTGCTVLIGPFRAACDIRGLATGTREIEAITPLHLAPKADAILLAGGSAFGLAAADGVARWLEERGGFGFDTGVARVPIVPAAVIFDLAVGSAERRPDAAMGRAACEAAGEAVAEGAVGAGTGATVGKGLGPELAMPGGLGTAAVHGAGHVVGALAVVNAVGDVLSSEGRIIAGARGPDGDHVDIARSLRSASGHWGGPAGSNTTLCVVATDAPLDRTDLTVLARAGSVGQARRLSPAHTPFDGDITFAVSTASVPAPTEPGLRMALAAMAADAVGEAIERAVTAGKR